MECPECGHASMDSILSPVTYHGVYLGRYHMDACPHCNVHMLTPASARTMRGRVDAAIRDRRLRSVPSFLSQQGPVDPGPAARRRPERRGP